MRTNSGAYLLRWLNSLSYSVTDKLLFFKFRNCFHLESLYISVTYFALNSWTKNSQVIGFGILGLLKASFHQSYASLCNNETTHDTCNTLKYTLVVFNMLGYFVSIIEFFVNLILKYGRLETRKFNTINGQNSKLSKKGYQRYELIRLEAKV